MKRVMVCLLFVCCFSKSFAGYEDGLIGPGEYEGTVDWENGLLIVDGGGADRINIFYSARIEVRSTSPFVAGYGGIWDIVLYGNSCMDYFGGQTEELSMRGYSTASLYGGRIDYISSFQTVPDVFVGYDEQGHPIFEKLRHIEMFVREYVYNPATLRLTGTWGDWTTFDIKLLNQPGYAPVIDNIKFMIIPEPASLVLFALGGLLMRKRKAR
jgi:hypothetical protein